jgi:hypothetical protein
VSALDLLLTAIDNTVSAWEPDDAVVRFAENLRRNIAEIAPEMPKAPEPVTAEEETHAFLDAWGAIRDLDPAAQERAMSWLRQRLTDAADRRRGSRSPWDDEPPF